MNARVVQNARAYAAEDGRFEITSVSVHEILYGLRKKGAQIQIGFFNAWIARNVEHLPAPEDYRIAAVARGIAQTRGHTLELADCLIAAVASRLKLPLVTGNKGHYQAIRDTGLVLDLENWRVP